MYLIIKSQRNLYYDESCVIAKFLFYFNVKYTNAASHFLESIVSSIQYTDHHHSVREKK